MMLEAKLFSRHSQAQVDAEKKTAESKARTGHFTFTVAV
jgi:hypothetical protein